jgi:prepilin-type processing-associated H-X9-DG protein
MGYNWVAGNASGWMPTVASGGNAEAGNPMYVKNSSYCLLANYTGGSLPLFHCSADPRTCPYSGTEASMLGKNIPVVRSYSMNQGVGTKGPGFGGASGGNAPVDGPWLNGGHSHTANNPYLTFGKSSSYVKASASDIWVFADDDPWTINDAAIAVIAQQPDTVDYVSPMHDNGAGFAFADGHSEIHKWKSRIWVHNGPPSRADFVAGASSGVGRGDWFWFAWHATRSTITGTVP